MRLATSYVIIGVGGEKMGILDNIKNVADIVRKADNIDLYKQILDLQQEAMELIEENNELKNEVSELKKSVTTRENLVFKNNMYYLDESEELTGPYCSVCWDIRDRLVRMHEMEYGYLCDHCIRHKKR